MEDPFSDDFLDIDERENEGSQSVSGKSSRHVLEGNTDKALLSFTQRSQRTGAVSSQTDETVKPRNNFENFLKSIGIHVKVDEAYKKYLYIDGNRSHPTLVSELEVHLKTKQTCNDVISWLATVARDKELLQLYITPMKSSCGVQDTIIRALLLCSHTQAKVFEILLCSMQTLAKSDSLDLSKMAVACVAQIRYLDSVTDSRSLFQSIFDRDIEEWAAGPRDAVIEAIPEVLVDPLSQQEATAILLEFVIKSSSKSPLTFRSSCLAALKYIKFSSVTAKKVRDVLSASIMEFDASQVPDVISLVLQSLDSDEKPSLRQVLAQLSSHLDINELRLARENRKKIQIDDVVLDLFSRICRYIQMDGAKNWKEVVLFLKTGKSRPPTDGRSPTPENGEDVEPEDCDKVFGLFDILLSFALMSMDNCPGSIVDNIKHQLREGNDKVIHFVNICNSALQYKKFCVRHCSSLINLARQCLWTDSEGVRRFGGVVYKQLFISVEKMRETVLPDMLSHMEKTDGEAESILVCLEELLETQASILFSFISQLYKCLDFLAHLNIPNIKRLFKILVTMLASSKEERLKTDLEESILKFTNSVNENEQLWGLLGILMQLESSIQFMSGTERERIIKSKIEQLEKCCENSVWLKSVFYEQLSYIIRNSIRETRSPFMLSWAEKLLTSFRSEFFITRPSNYDTTSDLESEKHTRKDVHLWLSPTHVRLPELVPLFELLKEVAIMRQRWSTDDDTQEALTHHWSEFVFIFGLDVMETILILFIEANIDMTDVSTEHNLTEEVMKKNATKLYYVIDWIRAVFNTFSAKNSIDGMDGTILSDLWVKKFTLLFECQKQLIYMIKLLKSWMIPSLSVQSAHVLITSEATKSNKKRPVVGKVPGRRKRKAVEDEGDNENVVDTNLDTDVVPDSERCEFEEIPVETRKAIILSNLLDHLRQMKLASIVRLICLVPGKRRATTFLLEEMLKIFKVTLPLATRKTLPWENKGMSGDSSIHGDVSFIWKLVLKAVPVIWNILNNTVDYFRADLNCSDVSDKDPELISQLSVLMRTCLIAFSTVLSCKEVSVPGDISDSIRRSRLAKRRLLMEKLEHTIIQNRESQEEAAEEAEFTFLKYLVHCAEVAPTIDVAVALLNTISCSISLNDELRMKMARQTLHFLKKDWKDAEGLPLKAGTLNTSVRIILEHFIRLRDGNERLGTIQWLLANKVADMVPDEERRKSKMATYQDSQDNFFSQADKSACFLCFTRNSFAGIYTVLFTSLNNTLEARLSNSDKLQDGLVSASEVLTEWTMAANSFCLLGLMLRVRELRNYRVLTVAAKQAKRFLALSSKKTSFIYVIEDRARFSSSSQEISTIIKSIQLGNRTLQNISVYAKAMKSTALLKALPELRASSELWMRAIHTAVINVGGQEAFEIGLLKSRDIDGEEICYNEDEEEMSSNEGLTAHEEMDDGDNDDEERSAVF